MSDVLFGWVVPLVACAMSLALVALLSGATYFFTLELLGVCR